MQPDDMARLAGINSGPQVDRSSLPDETRQMLMLAGLAPASGRSPFAGAQLVPDEPMAMSGMLAEAAPPSEDFARTMARAAGISFDLLEEGAAVDLNAVPPPVFAPPPGIPLAEDLDPQRAQQAATVAQMVESVPQWAWDLRDAVEGLINKTLTPKDALKAMQTALEASKTTPRAAAPAGPPPVVETEEQIFWKSYYSRVLEE